jgi:hypothetical protein
MIVAYRRRYIVNDLFSSVWAEAVFFKGRKNKGNFSYHNPLGLIREDTYESNNLDKALSATSDKHSN